MHLSPKVRHVTSLLIVGLTAFVSSARGAALELYETGAHDLGTASAGHAAPADDAATAAANPAGMTLPDRSQHYSMNYLNFVALNVVWKFRTKSDSVAPKTCIQKAPK